MDTKTMNPCFEVSGAAHRVDRSPGTRRYRVTIPKKYLAVGQTFDAGTAREVDGKIELELDVDNKGVGCV